MGHHCHGHCENEAKAVKKLLWAFIANIFLSAAEIIGGVIAGSTALIADALHNTSDALSILIAVLAYKIGVRKANEQFSFGFKRAETIGGFVNLILLFISGVYLLFEGAQKIIYPQPIDGALIIYISVLALIIDLFTAKISHGGARGSANMKVLFLHNLADALGSLGVIASGLFVIFLGWNFVDGVIAAAIAIYMLWQAVVSFPDIIKLLMNAAPEGLSADKIKKAALEVQGVENIHHIHLWSISENVFTVDCHVVAQNADVLPALKQMLAEKFSIMHSTIQVEASCSSKDCSL